jgi:hypothetical protein
MSTCGSGWKNTWETLFYKPIKSYFYNNPGFPYNVNFCGQFNFRTLNFSQQMCWIIKSYGMWWWIVRWIVPALSRTAVPLSSVCKSDTVQPSIETCATTHPTTQCHIQEDLNCTILFIFNVAWLPCLSEIQCVPCSRSVTVEVSVTGILESNNSQWHLESQVSLRKTKNQNVWVQSDAGMSGNSSTQTYKLEL